MEGREDGFSLVQPSFSRKDSETRHRATEKLMKGTCLAYSHPFEEHKRLLADKKAPQG